MIPVKEILLTPGNFFDSLAKQPESLKVPGIIILVLALVSAVSAAIASSASSGLLPPEASFMSGILPVIGFLAGLIGTFIFWILWAGILHIISSILKDRGSFTRTLEITGYGSIPQIFGGIISALLIYMHTSSLHLTPVTSQAQIAAVTEMLSHGPLMTTATVTGIIFLLWSANIWIFGVMKCRKTSAKNAAISVGIPVAAYVILTITSMI